MKIYYNSINNNQLQIKIENEILCILTTETIKILESNRE